MNTTTTTTTDCFRVHMAYVDGREIDTTTGTLCYSHSYYRSSGKAYTPKQLARKFDKRLGWKGLVVVRVEMVTVSD